MRHILGLVSLCSVIGLAGCGGGSSSSGNQGSFIRDDNNDENYKLKIREIYYGNIIGVAVSRVNQSGMYSLNGKSIYLRNFNSEDNSIFMPDKFDDLVDLDSQFAVIIKGHTNLCETRYEVVTFLHTYNYGGGRFIGVCNQMYNFSPDRDSIVAKPIHSELEKVLYYSSKEYTSSQNITPKTSPESVIRPDLSGKIDDKNSQSKITYINRLYNSIIKNSFIIFKSAHPLGSLTHNEVYISEDNVNVVDSITWFGNGQSNVTTLTFHPHSSDMITVDSLSIDVQEPDMPFQAFSGVDTVKSGGLLVLGDKFKNERTFVGTIRYVATRMVDKITNAKGALSKYLIEQSNAL